MSNAIIIKVKLKKEMKFLCQSCLFILKERASYYEYKN